MDLRGFYQVVEATTAEKLRLIPTIEQLEKYYSFLARFREGSWLSDQNLQDTCSDRMVAIRGEIQSRRMEAHSERQHGEAIALGQQTLKTSSQNLCWSNCDSDSWHCTNLALQYWHIQSWPSIANVIPANDNAQIRITGTGGNRQHFHAIAETVGNRNAVTNTAVRIPAVKLGHSPKCENNFALRAVHFSVVLLCRTCKTVPNCGELHDLHELHGCDTGFFICSPA